MERGRVSNYLLLLVVLVLALSIFNVSGLTPRIFGAILASALFFVAFLRTDVALILLVFSMLLSPEFDVGGIPGRQVVLRLDDLLLFVVACGWMAKTALNKELALLRTTPLNKPILVYIFICILSTLIGAVQGTTDAKHGVFYILKYVEYFILFFMVTNNIREKKQVKVFIFSMLLTCLIVSLYGLRSYFMYGVRATAPFEGSGGEANTLAGYLLVMMSLAFGLFLYTRPLRLRFLLGSFSLFLLLPFLYTLSRGGWFGFFPMCLTFLIFSKRSKAMLFLVFVCAIVALPFILPEAVIHRYKATFEPGETYAVLGKRFTIDESASLRIRALQHSIKEWRRRPILGHGVPGGAVLWDMQYARILREVGIVGSAAFIWLMVTLFKTAWRTFTDSEMDDFGRGLSLGFLSGLVGLLAMCVSAEVFIIIRIMEPFWFLAAIITMLPEINRSLTPQDSLSPQKKLDTPPL